VACNPAPLEVIIKEQDPKLVISSQVIPGDFMLVTVSRSFSPLKGEEQKDDSSEAFLQSVLVNRARVVIQHDGQDDTLFRVSPGVYLSNLVLLSPASDIRLSVYDSTTGERISAQSTMLPQVPMTETYIDYTVNGDDTIFKLHYTFVDPPESNWYLTSVLKIDPNESFVQNNATIFSGSDRYVFEKRTYDKALPNQNGEVTITERLYDVHTNDTLAVVFTNISSQYFDFLEARNRSQNLISFITGEPVTYPSNVEGGYGFFNTHNPQIKVIGIQ
jgi:hypothetical protein